MTIDEAVSIFERELPGWWWSVCMCGVSADATAAVDYFGGGYDRDLVADEALTFDRRFDSGFRVDLKHTPEKTFTPADALLAVLAEAKEAREAYRAPRPHTPRLFSAAESVR